MLWREERERETEKSVIHAFFAGRWKLLR